jgi:hypothetical protein
MLHREEKKSKWTVDLRKSKEEKWLKELRLAPQGG